MKPWAVVGISCLAAAHFVGCGAASRHDLLSYFFDGVPKPRASTDAQQNQPAAPGNAVRPKTVGYSDHGPYAAKLCATCHDTGATNTLVEPADRLCFKCHAFRLEKKYIHGPLASGGCLVCHDPHSSQYRYLLVSESDGFCFHCHERKVIEHVPAHRGVGERCTSCHDAHMSDRAFLLK